MIDFKEITEGYPEDADDLGLRITNGGSGGFIGIFDFGIIEGMIPLDTDRHQLLKCQDDNREEDEEDEDEDEKGYDHATAAKRKTISALQPPPAKRTKPSQSAHSRHLYLQWRGCETGEGEIQLDFDNSGYLDFTDATCAKFEGRASFDLLGNSMPFQGYKISADGGPVTEA